jgi:DNA polymerase V
MNIKKKQLSLPLFESVVSAGFPSMAEDYVDRALDLNELLIQHPAATFFVRVSGDSMIGAGIFADDILIVDRAVTPVSNKIVIARINDELTVKRFVKKSDSVILYPENPAYKPLVITPDMDFEVWGVVTCVIHRV